MGIVYEAEQREPVRRRVAIKMLKAGMDSKQVVGRFEMERQSLAVMDHPGIARVFDAGVDTGGRSPAPNPSLRFPLRGLWSLLGAGCKRPAKSLT